MTNSLSSIVLSILMVFAPIIGYVDQYRIIRKKKTSLGFSSVTCGILCFSNILRLFFWLGKRFDITLLFQSIVMLIAILSLLQLVVRYKPENQEFTPVIHRHDSNSSYGSSISSKQGALLERELELKWFQRRFWDWDNFISYVNCLLVFATVIGVLFVLLSGHSWFIELLGILSLGIESTLPLPQFLTHLRNRSTEGFSLVILACWFLGDGFKAFYYYYQESPIQFVVCAVIQLTFDSLIVLQFIVFAPRVKKTLGIGSKDPLDLEG